MLVGVGAGFVGEGGTWLAVEAGVFEVVGSFVLVGWVGLDGVFGGFVEGGFILVGVSVLV